MSYCLNPDCQKPQNPKGVERCRNCGAKLWLKDRYRPMKPIGQGGFGRTFLAIDEDKPSKPRCVVKQFFPSAQGTHHVKKAADLFTQEAIRLEELGNHPQIPALLAYFSQEQHQYLVQEFVDGKNLTEMLQETGPFTEAQVRAVLTGLLPVLDFVHSHRVIHRDIKPSNIICVNGRWAAHPPLDSDQPGWEVLQQALALETAQGFRDVVEGSYRFGDRLSSCWFQPSKDWSIADYSRWQQLASYFASYSSFTLAQRQSLVTAASRLVDELRRRYELKEQVIAGELALVDFGAAKAARGSALMRTGTTIGSPEYLAPEQARGKAVFSSDLYSLGVTCVQLLTNTSPVDLFDTHEDTWIWRRYLPNSMSERLGQILDRLLEPGTNRRYQSAQEVMQDLESQPVGVSGQFNLQPLNSPPLNLPLVQMPSPIGALPARGVASVAQLSSIVTPVAAVRLAPPSVKRQSAKAAARGHWQCVHQLGSSGKVLAIALSPNEPILASGSGTTIKLWDIQLGQPIRTLTGHVDIVHSLVISPDGRLLISGSADKSIRLWNLQTGQRLASLHLHTDTVLSLAVSPDGQTFASGSLYDPIKLWDLAINQEKGGLSGPSGRVDALAFSPDGSMLASSGRDATIALWNMGTGADLQMLKGHSQQVVSLAFSPDSKTLVSGSWDGTVKLWSTRTCREKRSLSVESGRVNVVSFSPSGKTIVTGSDTLQLWNARTGKELDPLIGHTSAISAIAFSHDEQTIVSSSWDGTIRVWRHSSAI